MQVRETRYHRREQETAAVNGEVAVNDEDEPWVGEDVDSVEDDGEQRKGKLSRVVADALTRLSVGTASTPRVHRLPRFPRIPLRYPPLYSRRCF